MPGDGLLRVHIFSDNLSRNSCISGYANTENIFYCLTGFHLCVVMFAFAMEISVSLENRKIVAAFNMASLATVCDALLISRYQNIIDVEFTLLYDESSSRLTFPYSKFERFDIDAWDESECRTELRFGKQDLDLLRRNLQIPDEIVCSQRSVCDGKKAMCILLKRLAYPCRYTDMVPRCGRNPTELCLIFNEVVDFIYTRAIVIAYKTGTEIPSCSLINCIDMQMLFTNRGRHLITVLVLWMALLEVLLVQSIINMSCIMDTSVFTV